jgi:histidinol phosphatase-like PHP family hydrolase
VATVARAAGASLVFGSDAHLPEDLVSRSFAEHIALGAGLSPAEVRRLFQRAEQFFR